MSAALCHRISQALSGRPLLIEPSALKAALDGIGPRLGLSMAAAKADAETMAGMNRAAAHERLAMIVEAETVEVAGGVAEYARTADGIAVIPVVGTLVDRFDWLAAWCGLVSYDALTATIEAAAADPQVKAILLDVDSPGGEASGMLDAAHTIRVISTVQKTIWASANSLAASAAFGLASAASRLVVAKMGAVGSVGVVAVHIDQSAADQASGLKFTAIYSGARKIDGWGHAPLSAEALELFQKRLDASRRQFAEAIAAHRGMSTEAVLATEAETYDDHEAVRIGFADAVQGFRDTLGELRDKVRSGTAKPSYGARSTNPARSARMNDTDEKQAQDQAADKHGWAAAIAKANADAGVSVPTAGKPVPVSIGPRVRSADEVQR